MDLVPERPPLLMVDRIEIEDDARSARAVKNVSMDEMFFQGHFPGSPIMPGVLQLAAMAQVGGTLLRRGEPEKSDKIPWLTSLTRAKFRKPVMPGDLLLIETSLADEQPDSGVAIRATASVDGAKASEANLAMELIDPSTLVEPPDQLVRPLPELPESDDALVLDTMALMETIPHRFPFLLMDKALLVDVAASRAVGLKNVTGNEPFFAGGNLPFMPGYLQLEATAQIGCAVALLTPGNEGKIGYFMSIDEGRFLAPIVPGDQVVIELELNQRGRFGAAEGTLRVGDRVVAEVLLKFAVMDRV